MIMIRTLCSVAYTIHAHFTHPFTSMYVWKTCHCFMTGLSSPSGEGVIGIGLDSCVMRTRHSGIFLIQTTDLYPML